MAARGRSHSLSSDDLSEGERRHDDAQYTTRGSASSQYDDESEEERHPS